MMEHYHRLNATISDLIMGNTYKFRVFSENKCGISEDATVSKEEAKIVKTGMSFCNRVAFTLEGHSKLWDSFFTSEKQVDSKLSRKKKD